MKLSCERHDWIDVSVLAGCTARWCAECGSLEAETPDGNRRLWCPRYLRLQGEAEPDDTREGGEIRTGRLDKHGQFTVYDVED